MTEGSKPVEEILREIRELMNFPQINQPPRAHLIAACSWLLSQLTAILEENRRLGKERDLAITQLTPVMKAFDGVSDKLDAAEEKMAKMREALTKAAIPLEAILNAVDWELSPVVMAAVKEGVEAIRAALTE